MTEKLWSQSFSPITQTTPEQLDMNSCHFMTSSSSHVQRDDIVLIVSSVSYLQRILLSVNPLIKKCSHLQEMWSSLLSHPLSFYFLWSMYFYRQGVLKLVSVAMFLITQQGLHLCLSTCEKPALSKNAGRWGEGVCAWWTSTSLPGTSTTGLLQS